MLYLTLLHLVATCVMVGIIWFVQVVHYPLFTKVGSEGFVEYESLHTRLTAWVVGPPMAVEGFSALALLFWRDESLALTLPLLGLVLLGLVQASTVFLQVPRHSELSEGFSSESGSRLVRSNWIRTIGWTARMVVAVLIVVEVAQY